MTEQTETNSKKRGRGKSQKTIGLIETMRQIVEDTHPITGRGVGYKLFSRQLIKSMSTQEMQRVYRMLKEAREEGIIPWEWIVDETRDLERISSWSGPAGFARDAVDSYRRNCWDDQAVRVEVWSEKGTVRGVLKPILDEYGVGFRVMHGFSGATSVHDIATDGDGRDLIALYAGDYDPSGLYMSECDLPNRLEKYEGDHVTLKRVALKQEQLGGLISFKASDKDKDPRYKWFTASHGHECWELDALDPNTLRTIVEDEIVDLIDPMEWSRSKMMEAAEHESLKAALQYCR